MNRDLRKHFLPTATNHDLRRYYAQAVWLGFDYHSTPVTVNRVVMAILGHTQLELSLHYNSVRLLDFTHRFPVAYRLPVTSTGGHLD
jgi:integrase